MAGSISVSISTIQMLHYLAKESLVLVSDLEALHNWPPTEDVDDGLLVCAQTLHGSPQRLAVSVGVEGIGCEYSGGALET